MSVQLPAALLDAAVRRDAAAPLVTYYDLGPTDVAERTELSAATLANWVAKTANFFVDDLDVSGSDSVAVAIPPHWQSAAILLATWAVGAGVTEQVDGADIVVCSEARLEELRDASAREIVATSLHPLALPLSYRPGHVLDYSVEVRTHGDFYRPLSPVDPDSVALRAGGFELTHASLGAAAVEMAERLGLKPADRVLVGVDAVSDGGPVPWLLAPLAAGASLVLVRGGEGADLPDRLARIADSERCTVSVGVAVPDLPTAGLT